MADQKRVRQPRSLIITLLAVAAGLMVALTLMPGEGQTGQTHAGGGDQLSVTWVSRSGGLRIQGAGFRQHSTVSVRVGSAETLETTADGTGTVQIEVALDPATVGQEGTSVIASGRAGNGSARTLVAASPPLEAGRGPVDVLPWSIGLLVVALVLDRVQGRGISMVRRNQATVPILGEHELPDQTGPDGRARGAVRPAHVVGEAVGLAGGR